MLDKGPHDERNKIHVLHTYVILETEGTQAVIVGNERRNG